MLEGVRRKVARWIGRGGAPAALAADHPLLFADHEEIRDIARQLGRSKVELDRSVLTLRSWARDLNRRLEDAPGSLGRSVDLRTLGETVGGLTHNFNNSLAAILAYTELLLKEAQTETAQRRLRVIRDVAMEASVSVRRFQEFVSREPQVAFGPVGLPAVVAEALEMTAPALARRGAAPRGGRHGHPGAGVHPARRGQWLRAAGRPRPSHPQRHPGDAAGRGPRHPRRQRGVGLGGAGGVGHRHRHAGASPAQPGRPGGAAARAGGGARARRGGRHRGAARRQHPDRQPRGRGHHGAAAPAREPLPDHPAVGGGPRARPPGARLARPPRGRRPAAPHRALGHAARRAAIRSPPRRTARRRWPSSTPPSTTWSSPTSACPR